MQPLTEEEKASRHILGRLYGPIATSKESTRNGRKYNAELWNKATTDDIFKEKVATKSLFLELGHPLDGREETDMEKVCACIPEMPKIIDGDLYAYVDILDTKNGRLLKTLCDYGFVPGISSRGSGDVDINDEVDPETFYLETFDIVALPAVKKARLTMCEQLDEKSMKLKKALTESLNAASAEDREIMKEALTQAKKARMQILDLMESVIPEPRKELSQYAPKIEQFYINPDKIKDVIGSGGKTINATIEKFDNVKIDLEQDGRLFVMHSNMATAKACLEYIQNSIREAEVGAIYTAKVTRIEKYGIFCQLWEGAEGLCHISKLALERVEKPEDVVSVGDEIIVKCIGVNEKGQIDLSRKDALKDAQKRFAKKEE